MDHFSGHMASDFDHERLLKLIAARPPSRINNQLSPGKGSCEGFRTRNHNGFYSCQPSGDVAIVSVNNDIAIVLDFPASPVPSTVVQPLHHLINLRPGYLWLA